jgi:16S rRNA (guanine966-N2)-methyltransferase
MRIISGSARGKHLHTFSNKTIRPTSDRVREALFSIITSKLVTLDNITVLDICAGTGALGIEALSRGAHSAVFIDNNKQAAELITRNCTACNFSTSSRIMRVSAEKALHRLHGTAFDLVFIDPPYNKNMLTEIIGRISSLGLLKAEGIICAEESRTATVKEHIGAFACFDKRTYGDTCIYLFHIHEQCEDQD